MFLQLSHCAAAHPGMVPLLHPFQAEALEECQTAPGVLSPARRQDDTHSLQQCDSDVSHKVWSPLLFPIRSHLKRVFCIILIKFHVCFFCVCVVFLLLLLFPQPQNHLKLLFSPLSPQPFSNARSMSIFCPILQLMNGNGEDKPCLG